MNLHRHISLAAWLSLVAIASLLLAAGCQDGSGPSLVTAPDGKAAPEGVKPPPPPPPNPELAGMDRDGIVVMNADGSNVTTVVSGEMIGEPAWSPDGSQLVYVAPDGLRVVNIDGSNDHLLVPHPPNETKLAHPRWSPAGNEISAISRTEPLGFTCTLWIFPASGGAGEVLCYSPDASIQRAEWNHDGSKLVFHSTIYDGVISTLQVIDRSTGVRTTVISTPETVGMFVCGSWARQGVDTIVYTYWDNVIGGDPQIYTLDISTAGQTPEFVTYGLYPVFSSDNSKIAFERHGANAGVFTYTFATGAVDRIGRRMTLSDWRR